MASSNRTYVLAAQPPPGAAPGLLMPYAVAAPGGLANVSGCATCTSSDQQQAVPSAAGAGLSAAERTEWHADRVAEWALLHLEGWNGSLPAAELGTDGHRTRPERHAHHAARD